MLNNRLITIWKLARVAYYGISSINGSLDFYAGNETQNGRVEFSELSEHSAHV